MINYVDISKGAIRIYNDDGIVGLSNSGRFLADLINEKGGAADTIRGSSLFIEAMSGCELAAEEGGFNSCEEIINLWDEVCENV